MKNTKPLRLELTLGWFGWLLVGMGAVFAAIGVVMWFVPLKGTATINGQLVQTPEQEFQFRLMFLLSLGLLGLIMAVAGIVLFAVQQAKKKKRRILKEEGKRITAAVTDCYPDYSIRINNRPSWQLRCAYEDPYTRQTYMFRSPRLRQNPMPYLPDGTVQVYHARGNIKNYFVDIEGSAQNSNVVEL